MQTNARDMSREERRALLEQRRAAVAHQLRVVPGQPVHRHEVRTRARIPRGLSRGLQSGFREARDGVVSDDERNTLIRIMGLVNGGKTPYDGQYVVEYDASRQGFEQGTGKPMLCHPYTFGDVRLIVQKGSNRYSRWYVLDEGGKYLSKGYDSQVAVTAAAGQIARELGAA
jgi:hypothetical protein